MSCRLVVGLGNPGKEYEATRHNIGFRVIDHFASRNGAAAWATNRSLKGELASVDFAEIGTIRLLKPRTFMNESGVSVQKVCSYYKIPPEETLIIYDEINIEPGGAKLSVRGSAGGHNGLSDIIARIKPTFGRLRIGVGSKPHPEMDLADFVLGRFEKEEETLMNSSMSRFAEYVELILREGIEKAMISINRKPKPNDSNNSQL